MLRQAVSIALALSLTNQLKSSSVISPQILFYPIKDAKGACSEFSINSTWKESKREPSAHALKSSISGTCQEPRYQLTAHALKSSSTSNCLEPQHFKMLPNTHAQTRSIKSLEIIQLRMLRKSVPIVLVKSQNIKPLHMLWKTVSLVLALSLRNELESSSLITPLL